MPRNMPYDDGNLHQLDSAFLNRGVVILDAAIVKQIIEVVGGVTYIGAAECGSTPGSAKWQIQRITAVGAVQTIEWADGDGQFDNIWDNRAALTYA